MSKAIRADFDEVTRALREAVAPLDGACEAVPLLEAQGRILSESVAAQFDFPLFDNSAMDGFALRTADLTETDSVRLPVCGIATAGHPFEETVPEGSALRIMTGALVPAGLDAVIPIEKVREEDGFITFASAGLRPGTNVRRQGEIFRAGEVLLTAPRRLTRGDIGLAASLGYAKLSCRPVVRAAVFSSGDELVEPSDGRPLSDGRIYNANGAYVTLAARALGIDAEYAGILPDDDAVIEARFREAAATHDLVICSGGVGPGDCDFTAAVLNRLADLRHYHVALRPGKPFSFGYFKEAHTLILGLPGNPVASATSAENFLRTAVEALQGVHEKQLVLTARLEGRIKSRAGRRDIVRGVLKTAEDGTLLFTPCPQQSSASLLSVSQSNAAAIVPEEAELLQAGDAVRVVIP